MITELKRFIIFPDLFSAAEAASLEPYGIDVIEITKAVYEKVAHRDTTEGIIAVAKTKNFDLNNLEFKSKTPLILVAEAPEKPGNIGALLRTADAANVDAIIISNPLTDLYNPNIIRSSVGGVFTVPIAMGSSEEVIDLFKKARISLSMLRRFKIQWSMIPLILRKQLLWLLVRNPQD